MLQSNFMMPKVRYSYRYKIAVGKVSEQLESKMKFVRLSPFKFVLLIQKNNKNENLDFTIRPVNYFLC